MACEYVRDGPANLFVVVDPTAGRRHVAVTDRRTTADVASQMTALCDDLDPDADRVRVVRGDPNTHTAGARYEALGPAEARRLAANPKSHYAPKHAPWPNMADLESSVLARQCSSRRIADAEALAAGVAAWQSARDRDRVEIERWFRAADARKKMARVYPQQPLAAVH